MGSCHDLHLSIVPLVRAVAEGAAVPRARGVRVDPGADAERRSGGRGMKNKIPCAICGKRFGVNKESGYCWNCVKKKSEASP